MQVIINGEKKEVTNTLTLSDLLAELKITGAGIAVELNREIVPRSCYGKTKLRAGDELEVIRMVQGG